MFDGATTTITIGGEALTPPREEAWKELHVELKGLGIQRSMLDARELDLLLEAEDTGLFRRMGYPTMQAYLVAELECSRHTANEKLRVARELIDLPSTAEDFHAGALSWSKVRELTRVVTAETEDEWLEAIEGKSSTEVQQMVKGFMKGSKPTDRPDPSIVEEWVGLKITPRVAAMWRQVRIALDDAAGRHLTDDERAEEICKRVLMPAPAADQPNRPVFQIAITTCRVCKTAEQVGPGVSNEISREAFDRALCDCVYVGDLEDDEATPVKASIPAPTRRKVFMRDMFECVFPGCSNARNLEVHHIRHREHGGGHEPGNLAVLCGGHHSLHHDGVIRIRGCAPDLTFERLVPRGTDDDGPPVYEPLRPRRA